ncbi:succinate dehydrogenase/fumarate reductase iron-sulfur subunit [Arcobacter aquimarinus]|uniref:Fumarate reductase iron-sulfur subunit n=1 Tax=Arcobacter aquimarinus TaxID=1315211 RepID=A0AAE7B2U4_9BACT|nr:2Fe-2S iron-sulfur cluster-binding protein [Arcobacter aquimarinus]QKE24827.1 succinate dehydrogenase, iron-sulfur subunit [Arcobacter aquimarinus]RXI35050.1 succinate dehydrogenase [Arcobacter aquimarinus]
MKIKIKRYNQELIEKNSIDEFEVSNTNLLKALIQIKQYNDSTLTFRCGCKSGVCGSCAVKVNGLEKLACRTKINQNDLIEPLSNINIIKDLVIDVSHETFLLDKVKSYIDINSNKEINQEDIEKIDLQSNCILCNSCYSSCPIYSINKDFIGPFALTRALRYVDDKKLKDKKEILNNIQTNGIWDCTLCGTCSLVCPQSIDPKADILKLQNISFQEGFSNPNLNNFDMNFDYEFDGFNPNGF